MAYFLREETDGLGFRMKNLKHKETSFYIYRCILAYSLVSHFLLLPVKSLQNPFRCRHGRISTVRANDK